jgi:hypothetical protein
MPTVLADDRRRHHGRLLVLMGALSGVPHHKRDRPSDARSSKRKAPPQMGVRRGSGGSHVSPGPRGNVRRNITDTQPMNAFVVSGLIKRRAELAGDIEKTAKVLGLDIPAKLLAIATR